ncbi:hypothetical protein K461DRAFT_231326 [Myriangium duriaei CBS 260.36]|uniref:Xylanolytic transcriptional activator regulatory domain-containing protein n=1 Tax=Myriangium duriaei CBS 260.36 TaxID=1168546 RepID=A0A9P4MH66_9PEZI|nr:hypothetical protein K461DRAFT_231326 [Myriangium duriaei CBS 260.36]
MLGSSSSDKSFPPACPSAALTSILWFTFLDNVDPVTKIVHVPTTSKIVDSVVRDIHAASAKSISMVFSIFLIAVVSMTETECERSLGQKRDELTLKFQEAACQSLQKANFLASHDLQLLQTFVMYTLALRQTCAPSALWILTGIAMRMAQRLGLHRDVYRVEFSVFETQLRRRLWWQVVILDSRATQLSGQSHLPDPLISNSNTRLPLNILDEDMSRDSSEAPVECTGLTDMVFCLIRYEFGQFLRDPEQGPTLFDQKIPLTTKEEIISRFETLLELKYLRFCDPSNPLHLLSSFMARSGLCKLRLQIHHPRHRPEQAEGSVVKRDVLLVISLKMTEQHNVARSTASIQRYLWHMQNYFQADAFVLLLIELRKLPGHQLAHHAWQQVAETLQYQPQIINDTQSALYAEIRLLILRAWTAYEEHVSSHCSVGSSTSFLFRVPDFVETLKSQVASNQSEDMRSAAEVVGDLEQSYDFDVNWQSWDELLSQPCRDDFFFNDSDCLS